MGGGADGSCFNAFCFATWELESLRFAAAIIIMYVPVSIHGDYHKNPTHYIKYRFLAPLNFDDSAIPAHGSLHYKDLLLLNN